MRTARSWLADASAGQDIARRYVQESESATPDAGEPDYAVRSLAGCSAMAWWNRQEDRLLPLPNEPTKPDLEARVRGQRQAARRSLLQELLALRKDFSQNQAALAESTVLARLHEQGRDERLDHYCQALGEQALALYARGIVADNGQSEAQSLKSVLSDAAVQAARSLFCELSPDMDILEDGAVRSSYRPAVSYLEQRSQARYPFGCQRRLFLLTPHNWLPPEECGKLADAGQGHISAAQPHAYVCEELAGISLGQVVAQLTGKHAELLDVVEHLHSRIDIEWSSPAQVVLTDESLAVGAIPDNSGLHK
jgi:hypothetical protein